MPQSMESQKVGHDLGTEQQLVLSRSYFLPDLHPSLPPTPISTQLTSPLALSSNLFFSYTHFDQTIKNDNFFAVMA